MSEVIDERNLVWSRRVSGLRSSAIREILHVVNRGDVISLAGGLPGPDLFPVDLLGRLAAELLASSEARAALQYGETEGVPKLRERIAAMAPFPAGRFGTDQVLITSGSQQGLDLIAKLLIDPGDEVLVETPAYLGALQVFRFFGARITFLPCDAQGVLPDALAAALRRRPKLLYLTPTFQNPTGTCYPESRRAEVRQALASSSVLIAEDDPYRELWFDEAPSAPLVTGMDPDRTLYLGTFSKTAVPGLRIAFLLGSQPIVRRFVMAKQATDLQTNSFGQHMVLRFLSDPSYPAHLERLRAAYGERRDALHAALAARVGDHLEWRKPGGGMFLWARLSSGGDAADLLRAAVTEKLAFVPGGEFHADGEGRDTLRLNFTHCTPSRLVEGVERLARALATCGEGSKAR